MTQDTVSLVDLIKQEQETSPHLRCRPFISEAEAKMTPEERDEQQKRQQMRWKLQFMFRNCFEGVLITSLRPKCLLALPYALANNNDIGTNAVMQTIFSDKVSQERIAHVEELERKIWQGSRIYSPGINALLEHFQRMSCYISRVTNCTVAECYWLMEICTWAGCIIPSFGVRMNEVLAVRNDVAELDFNRILDPKDYNDKATLEAVRNQYEILDHHIGRI